MPFLRNAWYVGAMSQELTQGPLGRKLLNENIVLYRRQDGTPAALEDRCPHRFVRLSGGKVQGDAIECPYHGLQFDSAGACVLQPFEDGDPAPHNRVRAYPATERYGYVWFWPGDPEKADPALLPELHVMEDETVKSLFGYLYIEGNYQLITDNLLDLTHVDYIHPTARTGEGYRSFEKKVEQGDRSVTMYLWKRNTTPNPGQHAMWGSSSARSDGFSHMHWYAPCNHFLDNGMQEVDAPEGSELRNPSVHLLTPETETTTHYFWTVGRNVQIDNTDIDGPSLENMYQVFATQDKPMIEEQQLMLGDQTDIMACHPVILGSDAAAVRARRILQKLIREENAGQGSEVPKASMPDKHEPA